MKEYELGQAARRGRREFLKRSMLLGAAGVAAGTRGLAFGVHVGGSDLLRIGLVGCGGRGTGAAAEALTADPNVKLVAMADLFEDRLLSSLATLKKNRGSRRQDRRAAGAAIRRLRGLQEADRRAASTWCCSARRRTSGPRT